MASKRVLAGCLGISAGVMLYVSFVEIFVKSLGAFEEAGNGPSDAYLMVRSRRDRRDRGTSPERDIAAPTPIGFLLARDALRRAGSLPGRIVVVGGRPSPHPPAPLPRTPCRTPPSHASVRSSPRARARVRAPRDDDDRRRPASSAAASR